MPCTQVIEVNALALVSPHQAYSVLWHGMTGQQVPPTRAAQVRVCRPVPVSLPSTWRDA